MYTIIAVLLRKLVVFYFRKVYKPLQVLIITTIFQKEENHVKSIEFSGQRRGQFP
jgi:hypothetical protein